MWDIFKKFIDEGRLLTIEEEIREGDFLFIQFGHNDEKDADTIPVLITPVERRRFVNACKLGESTHGDYVAGMKQQRAVWHS